MGFVRLDNPYYSDVEQQKALQVADHDRAAADASVDEEPLERDASPENRCDAFVIRARTEAILEPFPRDLRGATVVVVCAGLGNYGVRELVDRGAQVTITDLSPEVVRNAQKRWRNFPAVRCEIADAERLPYDDGSFDYSYCHAGLHHLPRPTVGIYEMYRVCRRQLTFVEAQDSAAIRVLVRLGAAEDWEPSGNYVYRFSRREIHRLASSLGAAGYEVKTFFNQTSTFLNDKVYPMFNNPVGYRVFTSFYRGLNALLHSQGNVCIATISKQRA